MKPTASRAEPAQDILRQRPHPLAGLNATFATTIARLGNVGFISQSGALCPGILDWSLKEFVGFRAFISVGSMLDVGWGDLIDYFGDDPHTRNIIVARLSRMVGTNDGEHGDRRDRRVSAPRARLGAARAHHGCRADKPPK